VILVAAAAVPATNYLVQRYGKLVFRSETILNLLEQEEEDKEEKTQRT
tara:strand:+ start:439 stop:582 length:144 start_codon:yes stop_codon:yes gene_type:complete